MREERSASGAIAALEVKSTWTRRHVLDLDDFSRAEIDAVMETTGAMKEVLSREVPRVPALRGKTIVTLFYEASTRTRASFELAAKALGADVINIAASGSSVQKGESLYDTVRTLQAVGAQMLVMRHGSSGAPYLVARHVDRRRSGLAASRAALGVLGPQATLDRGYAIVRRAADGAIVRDPVEAPGGTALALRVAGGELPATADER